jgi:hypothetical protein
MKLHNHENERVLSERQPGWKALNALFGQALAMTSFAVGAVVIFWWAGILATLGYAWLCSIAILAAPMFQRDASLVTSQGGKPR